MPPLRLTIILVGINLKLLHPSYSKKSLWDNRGRVNHFFPPLGYYVRTPRRLLLAGFPRPTAVIRANTAIPTPVYSLKYLIYL